VFEVSIYTVTKLVHFKSSYSSSFDSGAKKFKVAASHLVQARLNVASSNWEISFKLHFTILKLISCGTLWYAKVASLAAI
jgi:hypothetical protein